MKLNKIQEFVLDGQLHHPPPTLVNDYLNYLLTEGQLPQFEQSITKLPVECMDLHQVCSYITTNTNALILGYVGLQGASIVRWDQPCDEQRNARLYFAITGFFFKIKNNEKLQEMFEQMQRFVHKEVLSDLEVAQGNKLLLYLSCCLAGRAYPFGELPDEHLVQTVPLESYKVSESSR